MRQFEVYENNQTNIDSSLSEEIVNQPADLERINRLVASCDGPMPKPGNTLPPVYATVSITIDDEWDKLPLARQLHFAALAVENARKFPGG